MNAKDTPPPLEPGWFPLSYSLQFMMRRKRIMLISSLLFLATIILTAAGYSLSIEYVDQLTGSFLVAPPAAESMWGWIKYQGWKAGKLLFFIITRIMAFYLAFLVAYCLTTPGYVILSSAAEKLHAGKDFVPDSGMTPLGVLIDIVEGVKIALFGVLITVVALFLNFIPGLGQGVIFLLYAFYSALMFIDYPASRRRWSLGKKIGWIRQHGATALRLGLLPAAISMVPLLNVFLMSLLFPLLTIHSTINFSTIEFHHQRTRKP